MTTVNPWGYIVAPLAAPIAHIMTIPVWIALHLGLNVMSLIIWVWQLLLFLGIASLSLAILSPLLWMLRTVAQRLIFPRKLFNVFIVALSFLFSWFIFSFIFIKTANSFFLASVICGVVLNFLVFSQFFAKSLTPRSSGTAQELAAP